MKREKGETKADHAGDFDPSHVMYFPGTSTAATAFVSGFDLSNEEEQRRTLIGTGLFGPSTAEQAISKVDPFLLPEGAVLLSFQTLEKPRHVSLNEAARPEALHLFGVDRLSTRDLKRYFVENECIEPSWIEWINDSSCNAVFADEHTANWVLARLTIGPPIEPDTTRIKEEDWLGIKRTPMASYDAGSRTNKHAAQAVHPDATESAAAPDAKHDAVDHDAELPPGGHQPVPLAALGDQNDTGATDRSASGPEQVTSPDTATSHVFTPSTDPLLWWRPARPFPSSHNTWLPLRIRRATIMDVRPVKPNPHSAWSRSVRQSRDQRRRSYPPATLERPSRAKRFSAASTAGRVHGHIRKQHTRYSGDRGKFRRYHSSAHGQRSRESDNASDTGRARMEEEAVSSHPTPMEQHRDVPETELARPLREDRS